MKIIKYLFQITMLSNVILAIVTLKGFWNIRYILTLQPFDEKIYFPINSLYWGCIVSVFIALYLSLSCYCSNIISENKQRYAFVIQISVFFYFLFLLYF